MQFNIIFNAVFVLMALSKVGYSANAVIQPKGFFLKAPKLVVLVSIDQFRADNLTRFQTRLKQTNHAGNEVGGFQYLIEKGAYFPFAEYELLQAMTGPGHATLLTGAYPYQMGIPLNNWYDRETGKKTYCAEGMLPKNLVGSTVGDELKNAGYSSKVVSIALKDRAAILMGGHRADLALWFDSKAHQWTTSGFYGGNPSWVKNLNQEIAKQKGNKFFWKAETVGSGLSLANSMPLFVKDHYGKMSKDFPHEFTFGEKSILAGPIGLEMTYRAAELAIENYDLGKGNSTDILAVSFSSHDYMGHQFGPNSREVEEMVMAEDVVLSKLFSLLKRKIPGGLREVLIVLTADHGAPQNPTWLESVRFPAGRYSADKMKEEIEKLLVQKFKLPDNKMGWVIGEAELNFYLNHQAAEEKKIPIQNLENVVKDYLKKHPAIQWVFTQTEYEKRQLPPALWEKLILKTYFPKRSGDVVAIQKPFFIGDDVTVDHLTGYSYDRVVPLIFVGPNIRPGRYSQKAEVVDLAATLSYLLGVTKPSGAEGRVLSEAVF